jgi:hypothetical protein
MTYFVNLKDKSQSCLNRISAYGSFYNITSLKRLFNKAHQGNRTDLLKRITHFISNQQKIDEFKNQINDVIRQYKDASNSLSIKRIIRSLLPQSTENSVIKLVEPNTLLHDISNIRKTEVGLTYKDQPILNIDKAQLNTLSIILTVGFDLMWSLTKIMDAKWLSVHADIQQLFDSFLNLPQLNPHYLNTNIDSLIDLVQSIYNVNSMCLSVVNNMLVEPKVKFVNVFFNEFIKDISDDIVKLIKFLSKKLRLKERTYENELSSILPDVYELYLKWKSNFVEHVQNDRVMNDEIIRSYMYNYLEGYDNNNTNSHGKVNSTAEWKSDGYTLSSFLMDIRNLYTKFVSIKSKNLTSIYINPDKMKNENRSDGLMSITKLTKSLQELEYLTSIDSNFKQSILKAIKERVMDTIELPITLWINSKTSNSEDIFNNTSKPHSTITTKVLGLMGFDRDFITSVLMKTVAHEKDLKEKTLKMKDIKENSYASESYIPQPQDNIIDMLDKSTSKLDNLDSSMASHFMYADSISKCFDKWFKQPETESSKLQLKIESINSKIKEIQSRFADEPMFNKATKLLRLGKSALLSLLNSNDDNIDNLSSDQLNILASLIPLGDYYAKLYYANESRKQAMSNIQLSDTIISNFKDALRDIVDGYAKLFDMQHLKRSSTFIDDSERPNKKIKIDKDTAILINKSDTSFIFPLLIPNDIKMDIYGTSSLIKFERNMLNLLGDVLSCIISIEKSFIESRCLFDDMVDESEIEFVTNIIEVRQTYHTFYEKLIESLKSDIIYDGKIDHLQERIKLWDGLKETLIRYLQITNDFREHCIDNSESDSNLVNENDKMLIEGTIGGSKNQPIRQININKNDVSTKTMLANIHNKLKIFIPSSFISIETFFVAKYCLAIICWSVIRWLLYIPLCLLKGVIGIIVSNILFATLGSLCAPTAILTSQTLGTLSDILPNITDCITTFFKENQMHTTDMTNNLTSLLGNVAVNENAILSWISYIVSPMVNIISIYLEWLKPFARFFGGNFILTKRFFFPDFNPRFHYNEGTFANIFKKSIGINPDINPYEKIFNAASMLATGVSYAFGSVVGLFGKQYNTSRAAAVEVMHPLHSDAVKGGEDLGFFVSIVQNNMVQYIAGVTSAAFMLYISKNN